jgi:DNA invertase Pin-like site-specific DNA recombinase
MRLVEYRRVSTKGQARDGHGLKIQAADNRSYAAAHGHRIVKTFSDDGVKGALPAAERPGLKAALEMLANGAADGLLVGKLDRLARELTVQEATLAVIWRRECHHCDGHKHVFESASGEVMADDPDDPMRTAMRQMVGVFAQLDKNMVVKRLRDGRKAKSAEGRKAVGQYAYGYQGAGTGRERDAAPDDAEQAAVARIVDLRAAGESYRSIAATLDSEGLSPRKAASWSAMSVRNICLREAESA